jgi:hypothetical protein
MTFDDFFALAFCRSTLRRGFGQGCATKRAEVFRAALDSFAEWNHRVSPNVVRIVEHALRSHLDPTE